MADDKDKIRLAHWQDLLEVRTMPVDSAAMWRELDAQSGSATPAEDT